MFDGKERCHILDITKKEIEKIMFEQNDKETRKTFTKNVKKQISHYLINIGEQDQKIKVICNKQNNSEKSISKGTLNFSVAVGGFKFKGTVTHKDVEFNVPIINNY